VKDEVVDEWASAPWQMLSGKGLQELIIRVRSTSGDVIRNARSKELIRNIKERFGCGGEEEDGPGTEEAKSRYGALWKTWWDRPPKD
jgi:hypothetical protein